MTWFWTASRNRLIKIPAGKASATSLHSERLAFGRCTTSAIRKRTTPAEPLAKLAAASGATEQPAYYADKVGPLSLDREIKASGRIVMPLAASDSGAYIGFFNSASKKAQKTERNKTQAPRSLLAIHVEGPSREGHFFAPEYRTADGHGVTAKSGPHLVPGAKPQEWSLHYDPKGNGRIRVTLGKEVTTLELRPGHRQGRSDLRPIWHLRRSDRRPFCRIVFGRPPIHAKVMGRLLPLNELVEEINAFRSYLRAERGMAENTVISYGHDLDRFATWFALGRMRDFHKPRLGELADYLEFLRDEQLAPASVARHLAALKMLYRFLKLEERADPSAVELLASPALWERIPTVLSPENVEKLLRAPLPADRYCLRDRALLETLYATGCRASEVVNLKIADLYLDAKFCKAFGKGSKQRIVPLGTKAVNALRLSRRGTAGSVRGGAG